VAKGGRCAGVEQRSYEDKLCTRMSYRRETKKVERVESRPMKRKRDVCTFLPMDPKGQPVLAEKRAQIAEPG
jgi:hypothetical protein